jgi:hypothetical protein
MGMPHFGQKGRPGLDGLALAINSLTPTGRASRSEQLDAGTHFLNKGH